MHRIAILTIILISLHSVGFSQTPPDDQPPSEQVQSINVLDQSDDNPDQAASDENRDIQDFAILTFILVMFTNAVMCGHWAIQTNRNFWAWYIFGMFTGPLAGGFMLHRAAGDKAGGKNPSGCLAALCGIGIPFAGWIVWIAILRQ